MDESVRSLALGRPVRRSRRLALALGTLLLLAGGAALVVRLSGVLAPQPAATQRVTPALATAASPAAVATDELVMSALAQRNIGLADAPAARRAIVRTVRATGLVGFDDTRVVRVRPLARGRLIDIRIALGARVSAGQVLATYDPIELSELTGRLAVARAELARAQAGAEAARQALERARQLVAVGAAARADLELRTADATRASAAVRARDGEIAALGEQLQRFGAGGPHAGGGVLRAPIDGVVVKLDMVGGELVDVDRELLTIADLSTVWVQADVPESDLPLVGAGQDAAVAVAGYPDRRFAGRVAYVADMLDPRTNTARVRCAVANPDGALKLNMFATVEIAAPAGRDGVTVPAGALQQVDGKPVVFVRRGPERFERRDVRLGVESRDWVEIADGVAAGETVVTAGSFELKSILLHDRLGGD